MSAAVVQWGGGTTSWAVARIAIDRHGAENTTLLFADTLAEDEDLHRFNAEASAQLGVPITRVCDGRTPEQVDIDSRWLSNSKLAKCSHLLKQVPCRKWMEAHTTPDTLIYIGLDWTEMHRVPAVRRAWKPWQVALPLTELTGQSKPDWNAELRALGVLEPLMYRQGYPHNNCGGGCIRGRLSLNRTPYNRKLQGDSLLDADDWGGCGCFTAELPAVEGGDPTP